MEPSSQFGLEITHGGRGGEPHHAILHYTFSHEYSLEGIPMIDSRAGAWGLDKREYQKGLPRHLRRPPHCAAESTQKLVRHAANRTRPPPLRHRPSNAAASSAPLPAV